MNRKGIRILALVLCLTLCTAVLCGCSSIERDAKKVNPGVYMIRVAGGPEGSEEAALAEAVADALQHAGFGAQAVYTEDRVDNIEQVTSYRASLAVVSAKTAEEAAAGTGAFAGSPKELHMLMALGASSDGSRNILLNVADLPDEVAYLMLTALADQLDVLRAAADGTEITMEAGNTITPVPLQEGAAAYFKKQPWK